MTPEDRADLHRLAWLQNYYLDAWLANMAYLDLMRGPTADSVDRNRRTIEAMEAGEIDPEEAYQQMLADLRQWHREYQGRMAMRGGVLN